MVLDSEPPPEGHDSPHLEQGESESLVDLDPAIETEHDKASGGDRSVHDGDTASETSQETRARRNYGQA